MTADAPVLYRQERLPVFQNRMYDTAAAARACPTGDVCLIQDAHGLVRNAAFQPGLLVYDRAYQNEQGHSPAFGRHLDGVAELVARHMPGRLVEIGCGKAHFLDLLARRGIAVHGIDPAYEGDDPRIDRAAFAAGSTLSAEGVVLRHVLEHVADPLAFLGAIRRAMGGRGRIYVEVPSLDWILRERAWFDVFYEHASYFRAGDFTRLFGTVIAQGALFGGQYLFVVAELASLRNPAGPPAPVAFGDDFTCNFNKFPASGRVAVWGAASKGVIFTLLAERAGRHIDVLVDINPQKQGRFVPGSGKRVLAPSVALELLDENSNIYVMNPNYMAEIAACCAGHGRLLVPGPGGGEEIRTASLT